MSNELKPCPFCGGEAEIYHIPSEEFWYWGKCLSCHIDGKHYPTEAEAIAAWNTRADYHGYEQAAIEAWENIKAWNTRAELGSGTCEQVLTDCDDGLMPPFTAHCSACGAEWGFTPKYCHNCGAKCIGTRDERKAVD